MMGFFRRGTGTVPDNYGQPSSREHNRGSDPQCLFWQQVINKGLWYQAAHGYVKYSRRELPCQGAVSWIPVQEEQETLRG